MILRMKLVYVCPRGPEYTGIFVCMDNFDMSASKRLEKDEYPWFDDG